MYLKKNQHLYDIKRNRIPEPSNVVLRLQRNEKPDNWPEEFIDSIYNSLPKDILQKYPDAVPFYDKLASFLNVPQENLLVTSGIDEAIKTLIMLSCDSGDSFAVPMPGYAMYIVYSKLFNTRLFPIEYDPNRFMSPEELIIIIPDDIKILFLPNPCQPIENCYNVKQLSIIADYCLMKNILFAVDEAYHFFGAQTAIPLVEKFDNLIVLRSFSKAFGAASIRLGYAIGQPKVIDPLSAIRLAHEANAFSLNIGSLLLDCFNEEIKRSINDICQGRDYLRESAIKNGFNAWGKKSNCVLIEIETEEKMKQITESLKTKGIYVKGGFQKPFNHHMLVTCGPLQVMKDFFNEFLTILEELK